MKRQMSSLMFGLVLVILMTAGPGLANLSDGLEAYYPFDGDADDASGSGNHATAYNNYEYLDGVFSEAIRLVGSGHVGLNGGHVILPFIALDEFSAFTISMWVNHQGYTGLRGHGCGYITFGAALDCTGQGNMVRISQSGILPGGNWVFIVGDRRNAAGSVSVPCSSDSVGNWIHLVLHGDNGVLTAFVNGQSVGTRPYQLGSMSPVAGLGCTWFNCGGTVSNRFIGMIDDVRIYNRALDECEVAALSDVTPPEIISTSASPDVLWPANHKMVEVNLNVNTTDDCDTEPSCWILGVSCNEPVNGPGDGNTEPDWEITGDLAVNLRAERAGGGNGRTYTIHVICQDTAGNTSTVDVDVTVPHDKGKGKKK